MVDMSGRLAQGELLRASNKPSMSPNPENNDPTWSITIRTNGELIGHRNASPLIAEPSILLCNREYDSLVKQLDNLQIDYEPQSTFDETEFRSLTYLSRAENRLITYTGGTQDFDWFNDFDRIWKLLGTFAGRVGF